MAELMRINRYFLLIDYNMNMQTPIIPDDPGNRLGSMYNSSLPTDKLRLILKQYPDTEKIEYEERLPAVNIRMSDISTMDAVANFMRTFAILASQHERYKAYALYGLIPAALFPSNVSGQVMQDVRKAYEDVGFTTLYTKPALYLHNIRSRQADRYDIWVDRFSAADFLGCTPDKVSCAELFKKVVNSSANS